MRDYYGRTFTKEQIKNNDAIGFIEPKTLDEFSDEEISSSLVHIKDSKNGNRLYLLSELKDLLKANYYCRLEDPYTRNDILSQVPDFQAALDFEQHAVHYNASVLDRNPDFIPLLKTYVKEILHHEDSHAYDHTPKDAIRANFSDELDAFYMEIANFPQAKKDDFFSLFITNRRPYNEGKNWILPAKWVLDPSNKTESNLYNQHHRPFPHRNVLTADLIGDPEAACMHAWGMDILYLLLQYHIGTNKPFTLFDSGKNVLLEQELRSRVKKEIAPGSLNSKLGAGALELVKKAVASPANPLIQKLETACTQYMGYIATKSGIATKVYYPHPDDLENNDDPLFHKYKAVHELYSSLKRNNPEESDEERITRFTSLYNDPQRQTTMAQHRDNLGIRLLNIISSLLTLGIKNLVTHYSTGGYSGFWNSRGANLNDNIATLLEGDNPASIDDAIAQNNLF